MKITPAKDYRKPLYAIGLTATIMALAVTGCTDQAQGKKARHGGNDDVRTRETQYCKRDADYVVYEGEATLAGEVDVEVIETTSDEDDVMLSGGVDIIDTDETT